MNEATNGLNEVMFTSASVLDLLLQIDELKDYTIGMSETFDGKLQLQVGNSIYLINNDDSKTICVEPEVVGEIEVTNDEAYEEISATIEEDTGVESYYPAEWEAVSYVDENEPVEGGIIKEIAKALTLGGMIRFATKHLLK